MPHGQRDVDRPHPCTACDLAAEQVVDTGGPQLDPSVEVPGGEPVLAVQRAVDGEDAAAVAAGPQKDRLPEVAHHGEMVVESDGRECVERCSEDRIGERPCVEVPQQQLQVGAGRDVGHETSVHGANLRMPNALRRTPGRLL
ncbi:hypothetical protein [Rhodococcus oxybenzonivorans]|uniref:hypothetical protein n=1 Tax=Rhodococcus oxybenzonivorans TaxID=1990687 RepID=UPI0013A56BB6|nr:hypothetical protein [Rhodococcus oxybenzonivorans]